MTTKKIATLVTFISLGIISIYLIGFLIFFLDLSDAFGIYKKRKLSWYANDENYYTTTGTITEVTSINDNRCYLRISNYDDQRKVYHSKPSSFRIMYPNATEIWNIWVPEPNMVITFVSSDEIFYDGYVCPIVSIIYDGKTIFDFETGKAKLLESISSGG